MKRENIPCGHRQTSQILQIPWRFDGSSQVERISSSDLSKKMHVTASQIRQDLNNFSGFGQQGIWL